MKHFKLSKELTLGQNLTALVLILSVLAIFSPTHKAEAFLDYYGSDKKAESSESDKLIACEKVEKDLDEKLREMAGACASADAGRGCLQSIFTCNEDNMESEECESFSAITASPTKDSERQRLDEQKDELESLEKKKTALQDKQEDAQKEVDDLNSKYEDKVRELEGADSKLESDLKSAKNEVSDKLAAIQTNNKILDEQNEALFGKILDQKKQMIQIMTTERLICNQQSKVEAQKFYTVMRSCMSGHGNCKVGLNTLIKSGGKSLAEMTKNYERNQARKCLRVDGSSNDFAVKYKALQAALKVDESAMLQQQNKIAKGRADLVAQISIAQASGELANSEAKLKHAKLVQLLSQEKSRIQLQISAKTEAIKNYVAEVKAVQDQIATQNSDIASTRSSLSSSLDGKDLSKLREAQLIADSLISEAKYAHENNKCGCTGALKNISDYSGADFCGSSSEIETSDEKVVLEPVNVTTE